MKNLKVILRVFNKNEYISVLFFGLFFSLGLPPFNHETSLLLSLFPFISFISLIPLLYFSLKGSYKDAVIKSYLFGISASLTQIYWLANVKIEGLWIIILLGMCIGILYVALNFILYGVVFRYLYKRYPRFYILIFPLFWVVFEYLRTFSEISFPWGLTGYTLIPFLSISQLASYTGVYGLSFLIILGNCVLFNLFIKNRMSLKAKKLTFSGYIVLLLITTVLGFIRIKNINPKISNSNTKRVALIQSNIDQKNWHGRRSLLNLLKVTDTLINRTIEDSVDLILLPESGIYTYLNRDRYADRIVRKWVYRSSATLIFGTLHYQRLQDDPNYKFYVYNSIFMIKDLNSNYDMYHKIKLVPFSESLPFEGMFPILSRVNLGESDFKKGEDEKIFNITSDLKAAPYLCYEIIYPNFVRKRIKNGANMILTLTNDGWFGRSTAPYLHADMARMRSIEDGVSIARCANSGISFVADPLGRIINKTGLYTREVIIADIPTLSINTFYRKYGDWFPLLSLIILGVIFISGILLETYENIKKLSTSSEAQ